MKEVAMRYDTYKNIIVESPKASGGGGDENDGLFVEQPVRHDLFEATVEFDLHSVMAQTYHSIRPARPTQVLRKLK